MEGKTDHQINIRERIGELAVAAGAVTVAMGAVAGIAKGVDILSNNNESGHIQTQEQSMDDKYSAVKPIPSDERLRAAQALNRAASSGDSTGEGALMVAGVVAVVAGSVLAGEALRRRRKARMKKGNVE